MGAIIGTLGSCVASCAASCACHACCKCLGCECNFGGKCAHYLYVLIIFLGGAVSLGLRYGRIDLNVGFEIGLNGISTCHRDANNNCDNAAYQICASDDCRGYWAVYRVSSSMAVFFFVLMLLTSCKTKSAVHFHMGFWFAKVVILLGLFAGSLFLSNDVFAVYAWIARFVSPLFIFFMLTMFIDFGYSTNNLFMQKDDDEDVFCGCTNGGNTYKIVLILFTLLLFAGSFTATGFMYAHFPGDGCPFNTLAITTNLLFNLIYTLIGMTKIAPHASIFVSSLVTAYTTWMCANSLSSYPLHECNPTLAESDIWWTTLSIIIAAASIAYIASCINRWTGMTTSIASGGGVGKVDTDDVKIVVDASAPAAAPADVEAQSFGFYHLLMFSVSLYLAMLLTDWGVQHGNMADPNYADNHNVGFASAWLKLSFMWLCHLLYLWTLIAPRCCPNRDFGVEVEPLECCDR